MLALQVSSAEKPEKLERFESSYLDQHLKIEVGYSQAVERTKSGYASELKNLSTGYQRRGDFTNLQLVRKELTRFEDGETLESGDLLAAPVPLAKLQPETLKSLINYRRL